MKLLSFAFFVTLYLVFTHINCGIESSYLEKRNGVKSNRSHFDEVFVVQINGSVLVKGLVETNEEKGERCLKNVDGCLKSDRRYETTTRVLARRLFQANPPFDLSRFKGISEQCRKDSRKYIQDLMKFKLWALKMYDSNAKLTSGILNGNVNQFGDFDTCLSVPAKYCLASMQFEAPNSDYLSALHQLAHSRFPFKSKLGDPGHRVPRFSSINWALCIPESCSVRDVKHGFRKTIDELFTGTELNVQLEIDPAMCQTTPKNSLPFSTKLAGLFFAGCISVAALSTIYDFFTPDKKNRYVLAFSLRKNVNELVATRRPSNDIDVVHGIRFINAAMLLIAHKCMALMFVPYVNRTQMSEYIGKPWTVLGRAASLYTDPFIMLSGILTTYSLMQKLQRTNKINILEQYVSRLIRIVPTLAALITFCTFILPYTSNGPLWNLVVTQHANICKQYWWRNMLFVHNYFGFKDMCLTHTHHVGIDTQLFFLSPFMAILLWKWPKKGVFILATIATASTFMRYYVTLNKRLSNYIHYGTSIQQLFNTADYMYTLPAHRITVYIIGVLLGYFLSTGKNLQLNKRQLQLGNTVALGTLLIAFLGPAFMGNIDYKYNPTDAAWYAAYAPILWCFSFAWVIFTSQLGYKGTVSKFLGWKGFVLWTKISYTVYLTQFPVFFYNVGRVRTADYFGFLPMLFNVEEYGCIIICSAVMTLLFELPFQNLRNIIFDKKNTSSQTKEALGKVT